MPQDDRALAALQGAIEDLREDVRALNSKMDKMSGSLADTRERIVALAERDTADRSRLDKLDAVCETVSRAVTNIATQVAAHEKAIVDHANLHKSDSARFYSLLAIAVSAIVGIGLIIVHVL